MKYTYVFDEWTGEYIKVIATEFDGVDPQE